MLGALLYNNGQAAVITATTSGNWNNAATWGGISINTSIINDDIVIPSGITVDMGSDISISGGTHSLTVNGTLHSTNTVNEILISNATLAGNGTIDVGSIRFSGILANSTFTGNTDVYLLVNDGSALTLSGMITVRDTLDLKAGSLSIGAGTTLTMNSNSNIRVNNGTLSLNGGTLDGSAGYHVWYTGNTKSTGAELSGSNIKNVSIQLSDNSQNLSLSSNATVKSALTLNTGTFNLNSYQLTLNGDLIINGSAAIMSTQNSSMIIQNSTALTSGLKFTNGSAINNLELNITNGGKIKLMSNLDVKGQLKLMKGNFELQTGADVSMSSNSKVHIEDGTLSLNGGTFTGTSTYNVEYMGGSNTGYYELMGSGLNNVTVNLSSGNAVLTTQTNVNLNGNLTMTMGKIDMGVYTWTVNGTFSQSANSSFVGNNSAELHLNLTAASSSTLWLDDSNQNLSKLEINMADNGTMTLGSNLMVNTVILTKGKLEVLDHTLTIKTGGMISGYNDSKYIVTSGTGKLSMHINSADSYALFPVGTSSSYSPASIQQTSGGSAGIFMVSTVDGLWAQGSMGTNFAATQKVVNRTWMIEAENGVNVNMNLKLAWVAAAEVNGFNRAQSFITHYHNATWDTYASSAATSASNNTYESTRLNITSLSPFGVADASSSVSVDELTADNNFTIYPNPGVEFINIASANTDLYSYEVCDVTGKVLMTNSNNNAVNKLDISVLHTGFYFIKATNLISNESVVKSFVKQ